MFMSVHKGEGGVKIVPNPVHVVCECPLGTIDTIRVMIREQEFSKYVLIMKAIEVIREPDTGGVAVVGVVNCGHTGRLNDFVEQGAKAGALTIICGGGSRKCWRQVAPHGGARGDKYPPNPWAMGLPGGKNGPVL